jgi:hypothetical protein
MVSPFVDRLCLLLFFLAAPWGQAGHQEKKLASVTVKVADVLGSAVSHAQVDFLEHSSKSEKEQTTDEMGSAAVELQPGIFDLTVTSPGFKSLVIRGVELKDGEHRQLDVVLKIVATDCCIDPNDSDLGIEPERAKLGNLETSNAATQELLLRKFLQSYAANSDYPEVKATRYVAAFVHLRDDNTQHVIVYLIGRAWCGTGGCLTLILVPKGSSYTVLTEMTIVQQPIRVLSTKSHGWHDLGVWVQGGGIQPGYEARLSFDGKEYPSNPSVPPAQPLTTKVKGSVVVSQSVTGELLYP